MPLAGHDIFRRSVCVGQVKISIRVPLAGHDQHEIVLLIALRISIRVPLAGHDLRSTAKALRRYISIRVPLAGHDRESTSFVHLMDNFNPRAPCGARPKGEKGDKGSQGISIRVPLAGHDCKKAQRLLCIFVKTG